jgi:hypothetical protein
VDDLLKEIPAAIKTARRQLESIAGYELIEDLVWNEAIASWTIKVRLTCKVPSNEFIPDVTEWYVAIGDGYPDGIIKFYPDKVSGIKATFPHQNYNLETKQPFRSGDPCLNTKQGIWGRKAYSTEPIGQGRLAWHLRRCFDWLKAAASNSLLQNNDPFELPPFPSTTSKFLVAFNEDHESFRRWIASTADRGLLEIKTVGQSPQLYAVFNFLGHEKNTPESVWGKRIAAVTKEDQTGVWLLAKALPVLQPWQIPQKMGDLVKVLSLQGINLYETISNLYCKFRKKGKEVRMLAIGFPIPEKIGLPNSLIHWIALELPNPPKAKGFRDSHALHKHELSVLIGADKAIRWIKTENWSRHQLTRRGSVEETLCASNIVIIGCGAVGSILAEQLARLGVYKATVIDSGIIDAGNMSRHVLTITDVSNNKAEELAKRLNSIFPFMNVNFENENIQDIISSRPDFFNPFDLVIDATGDDQALKCMSSTLSILDKSFVSVSTGYKASKLFCFIRKGIHHDSIFESFGKVCSPWLMADNEMSESSEEVVDGIGCWHPLFPARLDDIQMLIGASVKVIESGLKKESTNTLAIIEKQFDEENSFIGIKVIKHDA